MTWVFQESDLEISVENALTAWKVDDPSREMQHCMKTVDFIGGIASGALEEDLKYKYRDSFLNEWASGRADKPIYYWVLIGLSRLSTSELQRRTDSLRRNLPLEMPRSWIRPIVAGCGVFNIATWNRNFPELAVRRLSDS